MINVILDLPWQHFGFILTRGFVGGLFVGLFIGGFAWIRAKRRGEVL
jgi:hypothetical protein